MLGLSNARLAADGGNLTGWPGDDLANVVFIDGDAAQDAEGAAALAARWNACIDACVPLADTRLSSDRRIEDALWILQRAIHGEPPHHDTTRSTT